MRYISKIYTALFANIENNQLHVMPHYSQWLDTDDPQNCFYCMNIRECSNIWCTDNQTTEISIVYCKNTLDMF